MSDEQQTFSDLWVRVFWLIVLAATLGIAAIGFWFLKLVYFIAS
jgi:hypothetical protein